jgi:hypothetical protein
MAEDQPAISGLTGSGPSLPVLDFRKTGRKNGNDRSSGYDRNPADWYVESAACVDSMLAVEKFDGPIWDPACGGGNILERCHAAGLFAVGSDIVDRGAGRMLQVRDFLFGPAWNIGSGSGKAQHIITNPPFLLADQFVERALQVVTGKVVMVQRLAFLEGAKRRLMFERTGLSRVWVHSRRQNMPPGGMAVAAKGGSVAYAWFVWDRVTKPGEPWTGGFLP